MRKILVVWFWVLLAHTAPAEEVRVLTLNTWLLDFIASDIGKRRAVIAGAVDKLKPDVISLQEVWGSKHKRYLIAEFRRLGYKYAAYASERGVHVLDLHDGFPELDPPLSVASLVPVPSFLSLTSVGEALGLDPSILPESVFDLADWTNGLLTLSRYPILEKYTERMNFSVDTQPEERLVEKGALLSPVLLPSGAVMLVVNTHLGAQNYDSVAGDYYPEHFDRNLQQLGELSDWIAARSDRFLQNFGDRFNLVLNGDMNFNYRKILDRRWSVLPHAAYESLLGRDYPSFRLRDVFVRDPHPPTDPMFTCGPVNPYSRKQGNEERPSEVLDYIFLGQKQGWKVLDARVVLTTPPSQELVAVSDHFGVLAQIHIDP